MAINETNNGQQPSDQQQRSQFSGGEQENSQAGMKNERAAGFAWDFHQSNVTGNPIAQGTGGEYLNKFRAQIMEVLKEIANGVKVDVLSLNRQTFTSQRFSALVVAVQVPEMSKSVVAYHTLILEATGEKLTPFLRTIDNQQVQVNRVTSDAFDSVMNKNAFDAVSETFKQYHVIPADGMVVPASISPDNKEVIENIARNAAMAGYSAVATMTDNFNALDLTKLSKDCRLNIDVSFGNHQVHDIVGNPIRSSVLINYTSVKPRPQSQQSLDVVNVADNSTRICELSGFLNPVWAPVDQGNGFGFNNYRQPGQPSPTQKFVAEFVITNVRTDYATSPAAVLLGLSSFLALVDNNTWIQGFIPRNNRLAKEGAVDITDIGALNITAALEANGQQGVFGKPINVRAMEGDMMEISGYLTSIFQDGCLISIDCPEARQQSWYLSPFADAAAGDEGAYNLIVDAANELTGGAFSRHFPDGTPMFSNIVRIPLGTYPAGEQLADIRNIDYTAIANIFAGSPSVIHDYSWTFVNRPGVSGPRNLSQRERLISAALDEQCTIDGYSARPTFTGEFIMAFSAAIAECNVPQDVNTPLNADQLRAATPSPSYVNSSLARNTRTFSSGFQSQSQRSASHRFGSGRVRY